MKNIFLFIFCVVVVFAQLSAGGVFFSSRRIPDLSLALVISLVLALKLKGSLKWILFIGVLADAGSSAIFGTAILAYFLVGWAVSRIANIADMRTRKAFFLAALAFLVAFSEAAKDFALLVSLKIKANYLNESLDASLNIFNLDYFFKIIYTIFAAYVLYYILRKADRVLFLEPIKLAKKY